MVVANSLPIPTGLLGGGMSPPRLAFLRLAAPLGVVVEAGRLAETDGGKQ
jgi:hypothetical protein